MDFATIDNLRDKRPAWRLLRARNAPLVLSFLGRHFVEGNAGATSAAVLVSALDEHLYALSRSGVDGDRFSGDPAGYLDDWAEAEWLRRFYPDGSDEVHYDATPQFEKAYAWVESLQTRSFVGTESRLHTVVELLRQIVHGADADPAARLAELQRRRAEIDREIALVEQGEVPVLGDTALRDRYQQFAGTARELLSDFREVEENFRALDRAAREKIAAWAGSKGELLEDLVGSRADITASDQGRSFQAFHDFLLSEARQDELSELLAAVQALPAIDADRRLRTVHHDWSDAAERTQQTVRQLSEQLRRFLDDQVWLENRRVLDLVRSVEAHALACRDASPEIGLEVDVPGIPIALPFERPLYAAKAAAEVDSLLEPAPAEDLDVSALLAQSFIDTARLADNIRAVVPPRSVALLSDIVELYPVDQGVAELLGYLSLTDDDLEVVMDDSDEMLLDYLDSTGTPRRARLPKVTVGRR